MPAFDSVSSALRALEHLDVQPLRSSGRWDVPQVLHHVAQSVEYSMSGFPALKPAWFRATLGRLAFAVFRWRGHMSHDLAAAIPGAPPIAPGQPLGPAVQHAITALRTFERFDGALHPHFAYGALDKHAYTRAHLMHLENHWSAFGA